MNTYYLWADVPGVDIGHAAAEGYESPFVVKVKPNGLDAALFELEELAKRNGKKRHLEIHCHGQPGRLKLGSEHAVNNHNVRIFGTALSQALVPGGLVEILACLVASQGDTEKLLAAPKSRIQGYREDYHGVIRLRRTRDYYGGGSNDASQKPLYGGGYTQRRDPVKEDPKVSFVPKFEKDGLRFCLSLAAASGCTIRAAYIPQGQDGGDSVMDSPIGNWECEVFDFKPSGQINFLGSSPYRGLMINSFDLDQFPRA